MASLLLAQSGFAVAQIVNPTPQAGLVHTALIAPYKANVVLWSATKPLNLSISQIVGVQVTEKQNELLFNALLHSAKAFRGPKRIS
jgi:hypothetical protein